MKDPLQQRNDVEQWVKWAATSLNGIPDEEVIKIAGVVRRFKNWWKVLFSPDYAKDLADLEQEAQQFQDIIANLNSEIIPNLQSAIKDKDTESYRQYLTQLRKTLPYLAGQLSNLQSASDSAVTNVPTAIGTVDGNKIRSITRDDLDNPEIMGQLAKQRSAAFDIPFEGAINKPFMSFNWTQQFSDFIIIPTAQLTEAITKLSGDIPAAHEKRHAYKSLNKIRPLVQQGLEEAIREGTLTHAIHGSIEEGKKRYANDIHYILRSKFVLPENSYFHNFSADILMKISDSNLTIAPKGIIELADIPKVWNLKYSFVKQPKPQQAPSSSSKGEGEGEDLEEQEALSSILLQMTGPETSPSQIAPEPPKTSTQRITEFQKFAYTHNPSRSTTLVPASKIMSDLSSRGLTPEEAAVVVGNMAAESTLQPDAISPDGGAFGLIQWRGPRLKRLRKLAASRGTRWSDYETQLDFLLEEFKTTEKHNWEKVKQSIAQGGVGAGARTFGLKFERFVPKEDSPTDPKWEEQFAKREDWARQAAVGKDIFTSPHARIPQRTTSYIVEQAHPSVEKQLLLKEIGILQDMFVNASKEERRVQREILKRSLPETIVSIKVGSPDYTPFALKVAEVTRSALREELGAEVSIKGNIKDFVIEAALHGSTQIVKNAVKEVCMGVSKNFRTLKPISFQVATAEESDLPLINFEEMECQLTKLKK